jgi:acyl carrier protein
VIDDERLDRAFRIGLGLPADADPTDAMFGRTPGWDSVGHMQLIVAIESSFGLSLEPDEVFEMVDHASVRRVLEERVGFPQESGR